MGVEEEHPPPHTEHVTSSPEETSREAYGIPKGHESAVPPRYGEQERETAKHRSGEGQRGLRIYFSVRMKRVKGSTGSADRDRLIARESLFPRVHEAPLPRKQRQSARA